MLRLDEPIKRTSLPPAGPAHFAAREGPGIGHQNAFDRRNTSFVP